MMMDFEWIGQDVIINQPLLVLYFVVLLSMFWISLIWGQMKIFRFRKRVKILKGRVCFRCGYEIGEGLGVCSECGAEWSLEDLGKGWRKLVEGEKG